MTSTSTIWRYGFIEKYSPVFERWVRYNETVTVRPDENVYDVIWRIAKEQKLPEAHIRIWFPEE